MSSRSQDDNDKEEVSSLEKRSDWIRDTALEGPGNGLVRARDQHKSRKNYEIDWLV